MSLLTAQVDDLSAQGSRFIAVALSQKQIDPAQPALPAGLTLVGVIGMADQVVRWFPADARWC